MIEVSLKAVSERRRWRRTRELFFAELDTLYRRNDLT